MMPTALKTLLLPAQWMAGPFLALYVQLAAGRPGWLKALASFSRFKRGFYALVALVLGAHALMELGAGTLSADDALMLMAAAYLHLCLSASFWLVALRLDQASKRA